MNNKKLKILKNLTKILIFVFPTLILAAGVSGIIPCEGADCSFDSLIQLVNKAIDLFMSIAASIAAVVFAYAGALIIFNPNNPGERTKAIAMFKKTLIGLAIFFTSWLIIHTIIVNLLTDQSALKFLQ